MTKDDILLALRLTAMGRAGHPLQEQLAESLERVFASQPNLPAEAVSAAVESVEISVDAEVAELQAKRRGRPPKQKAE